MRKCFAAVFVVFVYCGFVKAQKDEFNPITTGVPSLSIAPDARGGGMGDVGGATTPDVNSQFWNPAKYAFMYDRAGISLSYTPWLRKLVNDIYLAYLAGFWKLGSEDQHAMSASLRYFSLGDVLVTNDGKNGYNINPYELAVDLGYSIKLSETFSGGVVLRYIYSDLAWSESDEISPGWAIAADVAGYYNKYVMLGSAESLFSFGFNISNIGSKISYDNGANSVFLPTNLRLGVSLLYPVSTYNTFAFNIDLNKLLVPTPPDYSSMSTDKEKDQARLDYQSIGPVAGIFKSFSDAPGGFKEELEEIMWSVGAEYAYNDQFFLRGGYYHESENKGNRKYFSLGAGFKMSVFQLDAAYLISTAQSNPLDQTLRFSLSFNMDGLKDLFGRR